MQGLPKNYIKKRDINWKPDPINEQVTRIRNSVEPVMAEALVKANCPYLKIGERMGNLKIMNDEQHLRFAEIKNGKRGTEK